MTYGRTTQPGTLSRAMLRPGERLLWQGQPDVRAYSLRGAWYLIPFSILWGGFAIFWEVGVLTSGAPLFFGLWGVPFVAIGLYMAFGRIPLARREARRTLYSITDQRVLIETGGFSRRLTEMALEDLPPAQLETRDSGLGTISFGATMSVMRIPPGWPTAGAYQPAPAFTLIPDAGRVYQVLQDAKAVVRQR